MKLETLSAGETIPHDVYAFIEIVAGCGVKYELCKESGVLFVDRFLSTSMHYPCHYGFIPKTLGDDGDPLDILVLCPTQIQPGCLIQARPIGMLLMEDEKGLDEKIIAVPVNSVCALYASVASYKDLPESLLNQIRHFFEHYKDLETGKWVKLGAWQGVSEAGAVIMKAAENAKKAKAEHDNGK